MGIEDARRRLSLPRAIAVIGGVVLGVWSLWKSFIVPSDFTSGSREVLLLVDPAICGLGLMTSCAILWFRTRLGLALYFLTLALRIAFVVAEVVSGKMVQLQIPARWNEVLTQTSVDVDFVSILVKVVTVIGLGAIGFWAGRNPGALRQEDGQVMTVAS
jgi:hypothetical protein